MSTTYSDTSTTTSKEVPLTLDPTKTDTEKINQTTHAALRDAQEAAHRAQEEQEAKEHRTKRAMAGGTGVIDTITETAHKVIHRATEVSNRLADGIEQAAADAEQQQKIEQAQAEEKKVPTTQMADISARGSSTSGVA